jgi:hypothetical protein
MKFFRQGNDGLGLARNEEMKIGGAFSGVILEDIF